MVYIVGDAPHQLIILVFVLFPPYTVVAPGHVQTYKLNSSICHSRCCLFNQIIIDEDKIEIITPQVQNLDLYMLTSNYVENYKYPKN